MTNLSKRERTLITLLVAVMIILGFYKLVYEKQLQELEALELQEAELLTEEPRVRGLTSEIGLMEAELEKIAEDINLNTVRFFPELIQEKIILIMNEDLQNAEIKEASIAYKNPEFIEINRRIENENVDVNDEAVKPYTAWGMTASVSFSCSYEQLLDYLRQIKDYQYSIIINNLSIATSGDGLLYCSAELAFYSIPKQGDDAEYLEWDIENEYGSDNPFIAFSDDVVNISQPESSNETLNLPESDYDFFVMAKPSHSDMPAVTIGRTNDNARQTYVSAENNGVENCSITISEKNGKYYYSYGTSERSYPGGSSREFAPYDTEKIIIRVLSTPRTSDTDLSGVRLTVTNQTKLPLQVIVVDDDTTRPRVTINTVGTVEII